MKGKHNKGKGKYVGKGQERYTNYTGGKNKNTTPYSKGKGRYQSRPYYVKGEKNPYHNSGSYGSCSSTYGRP
eukprot:4828778-Amphidinium_carterae.1